MPLLSARFKSTVVSFIGFIWLFSLPIASNISEVLAQANDPRNDPRSAPRVYKYEAPEVWRESVIDLPALSPKSSFTQYQTRSQTGFNFYVDVSSISFSADGVVRMSLLAISPKGSENITYEGFRCETKEYKLYALTWAFDANWLPTKGAKWRTISPTSPNSYRGDLLEYYICNGAMTLEESRLNTLLKNGKMNWPGRGGKS
jgi:hypothetical protein